MDSYAQTNIQLYNQLKSEGYPKNDLLCVFRAYELVMQLFTSLFRPSGKTFIDHSIGTASILASLHSPVSIVIAGLLHAVYVHGDFGGTNIKPVSNDMREQVRHAIGEQAEKYVAEYTALKWNSQTIPDIRDRLDTLNPVERDVVLMRLANELDDNLSRGALYCSDADKRKRFNERCGHIMVDMAGRLGFPTLATELERAFGETMSAEVPQELRSRSRKNRAYLIVPKSYRKRLSSVCCHLIARFLASSRKLSLKTMKIYNKFLAE